MTGRRVPQGSIARWLEAALATPSDYLDALSRAGGLGAVLVPEPVDDAGAAQVLDGFAGLVLTGGIDVDPRRYGQQPAPETYGCDEATDTFEIALARAALSRAVPLLAICRGCQVLNVALGGTLDQHITGRPGLVAHGIPNGGGGVDCEHRIEAGTRLHAALGVERSVGRCHHHQSVARLGASLRVSARATDGIVEAVEPVDAAGWCVAVQWHPEESAAVDPVQQRLFDAFVDAARQRRRG
ncbi:MAG: gamma-glutamyl-gamma-aminobutyrate hydrolase family protein [Actinobacteria bacterium]|nr:gamma-glutamyl-gamma-aminobutyrate hydrolase family protein [Actinomycetota bacterium]